MAKSSGIISLSLYPLEWKQAVICRPLVDILIGSSLFPVAKLSYSVFQFILISVPLCLCGFVQ